MTDPHFRDLDHLRGWLAQFDNPDVHQSRDHASLQMLSVLAFGLQTLVKEIDALKAPRPAGDRAAGNERLARRWFEEVWNQRRTDTVYELVTPDSVCHSEAGPLHGPEPFLDRVFRPFTSAFPDARVTVEATLAAGDDVVVRWSVTATHAGEGLGIPRTGRRVTARGMTWIRYKDGKMHEGWDCWNQTGVLEALRTGQSAASVSVS